MAVKSTKKRSIKVKKVIGVCFICGGAPKELVPGHDYPKLCPQHHSPKHCRTCKKQAKPELRDTGYIAPRGA